MSRRDTILVAVLINAGLLIVLFASALKSNTTEQELVLTPKPALQEVVEHSITQAGSKVLGDEVDQALNQYAHPPASLALAAPQTVPSPTEQAPSTHAFIDDFKFAAAPERAAVVDSSPQSESATNAPVEHKVKKGDVLEKIARYHHCTVDQIMKLNNLMTSNLRIGQVLKIPAQTAPRVSPPH